MDIFLRLGLIFFLILVLRLVGVKRFFAAFLFLINKSKGRSYLYDVLFLLGNIFFYLINYFIILISVFGFLTFGVILRRGRLAEVHDLANILFDLSLGLCEVVYLRLFLALFRIRYIIRRCIVFLGFLRLRFFLFRCSFPFIPEQIYMDKAARLIIFKEVFVVSRLLRLVLSFLLLRLLLYLFFFLFNLFLYAEFLLLLVARFGVEEAHYLLILHIFLGDRLFFRLFRFILRKDIYVDLILRFGIINMIHLSSLCKFMIYRLSFFREIVILFLFYFVLGSAAENILNISAAAVALCKTELVAYRLLLLVFVKALVVIVRNLIFFTEIASGVIPHHAPGAFAEIVVLFLFLNIA